MFPEYLFVSHDWLHRITCIFYTERAMNFSVTYVTQAFILDNPGCS